MRLIEYVASEIRTSRSFLRGAVGLAGGAAAAQLITVLFSPILTRLYSPRELGVLAAYSALIATLVIVGSLRYELVVTLAKDQSEARNALALSLTLAILTALISGFALTLFGGRLNSDLWGMGGYGGLFALSLAGAAIYQAFVYWALRTEKYARVAVSIGSQSLATSIGQCSFGLAGFGTFGLLLGDAAGRLVGGGLLAYLSRRQDGRILASATLGAIRRVAIHFRRFPSIATPAALLNGVGLNAPTLLIAGLFGPLHAGLFALSRRVIGLPMNVIGHSVSQAYVGRATRLLREDAARLPEFFTKSAAALLVLGVLPIGAVSIGGPWLFSVVFGGEWAEGGTYIRVLGPAYLGQFVVAPVSQTLNLIERQGRQFIWDASRLAIVLGSLIGGKAYGLTAIQSVAVYSAATVFAYIWLFVWSRNALQAVRDVPRLPQETTGSAAPNTVAL